MRSARSWWPSTAAIPKPEHRAMKYVLPIAAMLATGLATLLMLVLMVAGAANSSDEQLRTMKLWAGGLSLLSLVCVVLGIVLLRQDRSGHAALVAFIPVMVMGFLLLLAVVR